MIEIVINYDQSEKRYKIYEPTTDTLLISNNLTEALVNLSGFLVDSGMIKDDILSNPDISYHFDSYTMRSIIESNVNLMKRLKSAPSGFMISSQKFGSSTIQGTSRDQRKDYNGNKQKRFSGRGGGFSGKTGFSASNKKFGGIN